MKISVGRLFLSTDSKVLGEVASQNKTETFSRKTPGRNIDFELIFSSKGCVTSHLPKLRKAEAQTARSPGSPKPRQPVAQAA